MGAHLNDHHSDHHTHTHSHVAPKDFGRAFALGALLNTAIVVLQVIWGLIAHSTALLADAGHNLSDVLGLIVAWAAASLARMPPTERYTYGFRSSSIIAALLNALFLLVVMGGIAWEAIQRFSEPVAVQGKTVMIVAGISIIVNGASAWLFASGRKGDINIRGAFLHMLSDALVSFGVVCAGGLIVVTQWQWLDPLATLVITAIIVYGTWELLKEAFKMSLAGVPENIDPKLVRTYLSGLPGVQMVHDLHIWPMSTTQTALTCHLVMPQGHPGDAFTSSICNTLHEKFAIEHATLQIELTENAGCRQQSDAVI